MISTKFSCLNSKYVDEICILMLQLVSAHVNLLYRYIFYPAHPNLFSNKQQDSDCIRRRDIWFFELSRYMHASIYKQAIWWFLVQMMLRHNYNRPILLSTFLCNTTQGSRKRKLTVNLICKQLWCLFSHSVIPRFLCTHFEDFV